MNASHLIKVFCVKIEIYYVLIIIHAVLAHRANRTGYLSGVIAHLQNKDIFLNKVSSENFLYIYQPLGLYIEVIYTNLICEPPYWL